MAKSTKKNGSAAKKAPPAKAAPAKKAVAKTTEVRNTARPRTTEKAKPLAVKPLVITGAMISERAYHIHLSGAGGSQDDNWHRAERELRGL